ncbi:hypothetical protein RIF29_25162 [Crotalaria pallida]|uniref:Uncharacterized protein n=1 Tax=Crotalaria pallida TaxID=3830 RepID=A0AAN9HX81_CROPI
MVFCGGLFAAVILTVVVLEELQGNESGKDVAGCLEGIDVHGGMMSLVDKSKTEDSVKCEVVDGELKSRRHLNVKGKSATLPSITG